MGGKKIVVTQFATKVELKTLTHIFGFPISSWKLYKKGVFFLCFHIKRHVPLGMNSKKFNTKNKT
jgi:hypothetical protein